ncbi:MAG: hypothetical protein JNK72_17905 [Myxococcales bacterium]|nr:hypothetical protein [Myxococcales bacterium]
MRSVTPLLASVLGFALVSLAAPVRAQELPVTTRTMALGGGTYGSAMSTAAVYANPAMMGLARTYHIDSNGLYSPNNSRWMLGGTVVDSTRRVGAGVSYNYGSVEDEDRSNHDARLALSLALGDSVALGLTGRYLSVGAPNNGQSNVAFSGFTLDAGLAVRPIRALTLGVTGFSLTSPETRISPLAVGAGFGLNLGEALNLVGDSYWDFQTFGEARARWSGGVEVLLGQAPLRLGYAWDDTRGAQPVHVLTAGIGYLDPVWGVELSMRQEVAGGNDTTLLVNLRRFVQVN